MASLLWTHSPGSALVALLVTCVALLWRNRGLFIFALCIWIFLIVFFRGFSEPVNPLPNVIVSPCDGVVLETRSYKGRVRIVVALHLLDRHVQIAPIHGAVLWQKYKEGEFNPVFLSVKTHLNERMETAIHSPEIGTVIVTQVAGQLARRIVSFVAPGQELFKGQQIGLIKFGSQCELDIPFPTNASLFIKPGDKVRLGQEIAMY